MAGSLMMYKPVPELHWVPLRSRMFWADRFQIRLNVHFLVQLSGSLRSSTTAANFTSVQYSGYSRGIIEGFGGMIAGLSGQTPRCKQGRISNFQEQGAKVDEVTHQLFFLGHNTGARVVDDCHVRGVHGLAEKLHTADTEFQF